MNVVIGLCGKSCVGKTGVAKVLGRRLHIKVRHCGEIVKARARELGIDFRELSNEEHKLIDQATRNLAEHPDGTGIMEGRFLEQVLKGVPGVLLIRLECSEDERLRRAAKGRKNRLLRAPKTDNAESFHERRGADGDVIAIATDGLTVSDVVNEVKKHVENFLYDPT